MDYLRAKILWNHLESLSIGSSDVSNEFARGMAYASSLSLLDCEEDEGVPLASLGGLTSNDAARYGSRRLRLTQTATEALAETLNNTLNEITLYYHATEELDAEELQSRALKLDEHIKADVDRQESDTKEFVSQLDTVLNLHQEAAEVLPRLQASLGDALRRLPSILNANHTASNDLLALTIETSLLKLSVVRARLRASLYGYTPSSNPSVNMAGAIANLHEKLTAQERILDAQERNLQERLHEYQQLLELVDGQGGGFAQVVEDMARVQRETEDCRKDLRRLGWTEQ